MNCNKCGTANEDGSKFCKECGQKLTEFTSTKMLSTDEHLKVGEFVYLAYRESEAGHLDQAIEACQGALAINDANPAIHGLLASIYERKGDLARSIYEYERLVSLNPGSLEDRRKLEQLRMQLISPAPVAAAPVRPKFRISDIKWLQNRQAIMPWIAAIAVFAVVVVLAGGLFLKNPGRPVDSTGVGTRGRTQPAAGPNGDSQVPGISFGNPNGDGTEESADGQQPSQPGVPNATSPEKTTRPGIPSVRVPGTTPAPQQTTTTRAPTVKPPSNSISEKPVIQPIIRPQETVTKPSPSPVSPIKPAPEPVIKPAQPAKNAEERGRELQRMGKYDDAIGAYREALNQTSDPGRVYQHMAMSYERKGEHDAAIDNYNRAIKAYRDQLATGRSRSEVESGIRACEAGIEVSRNRK